MLCSTSTLPRNGELCCVFAPLILCNFAALRPHLIIIVLVLLLAAPVAAQQTIYDETTIIYKKEIHGGLMLHGDGCVRNP